MTKETIPQQIIDKIERHITILVPNPSKHAAPFYTTADRYDDLREAAIWGYGLSEGRIREYELAITSLTPGGSEYVNDPQACVDFVRVQREHNHELIVSLTRKNKEAEGRIKELEAEVERLEKIIDAIPIIK